MDVVSRWDVLSNLANLLLDIVLFGKVVNSHQKLSLSLIDGRMGPGLGQTLEEVADVGLDGLLVGAVVNLPLNGVMDAGNLVQNCLDMVLQSWETLLEHGVTVSQCFGGVIIQAFSKITDTVRVS